jgi:hypothetical protein
MEEIVAWAREFDQLGEPLLRLIPHIMLESRGVEFNSLQRFLVCALNQVRRLN